MKEIRQLSENWQILITLMITFDLFKICLSAGKSKSHKVSPKVFKGNRGRQSQKYSYQPTYSDVNPEEWYDITLSANDTSSIPDEQLLIARLLYNYDPAARPVYNASDAVVVRFGFLLIQICDMDERNQVLTTNVWLEQEWLDERLQWNSSDYNNLDKIRIPCNRLWLPDIVLYNSADDFTETFMQSKAMVKPNGEVFWPPPAKLRSSCKIDVTFFPFDDQVCHIRFGSWTYSGLQLDLINKSNTSDLVNYIKSGEWELKQVVVVRNLMIYPCCPNEPYPDIIFYIHIRRRILYYLFNIIFPCVWLSILSLIGFWLPPDTGEKITLGITVLLAFSVFMLLIAENIPATSENVPLIGIYLTITMSLTSLSIILTVFVLQLHYNGQWAPRVSPSIYRFMTRRVAYVLWMSETVRRYESCMRDNLNKFKCGADERKFSHCEQEINKLKTTLKNIRTDSETMSRSSLCCCCPTFKEADNSKHVKQNGLETTTPTLRNLAYPDEFNDMMVFECLDTTTASQHHNHHHHRSHNKKHKLKNNSNTTNKSGQSAMSLYKKQLSSSSSFPSHLPKSSSQPQSPHVPSPKPPCCEHHQQQSQPNKELMKTLEIFSANLRQYLASQETDAIKSNIQSEWQLLALIVDRILFWIFASLTVISSVFLLVLIPIWKNEFLSKINLTT